MGEPVNAAHALGEDVRVVLRLGSHLAAAGTGSYRVRQAMRQVAAVLGIEHLDASITTTFIALTARRGEEFRTVVREISSVGVDAGRIAGLERVAAQVRPGVTAAEVDARITAVQRGVRRWGMFPRSAAAGVGCAAFALLNGFGVWDAVAVIGSAGVGQAVRMALTRRHVAPLGVVGACSAVSCLVFLAVATGLAALTGAEGITPGAGLVTAVLYLVPGFPLYTGLLDLAHQDLLAGAGRLLYAGTVVVTSGGVVWFLASITGVAPAVPTPHELGVVASVLLWGVGGFVGVAAFAMLFDARLRIVFLAGAIGAAANLTRMVLVFFAVPAQTACFTAGLVIGLLAAVAAQLGQVPRITVSVPAAIIMVPGTLMYRALYHLNAGAMSECVSETAHVALLLISIGAGLGLARLCTDPAWTFDHRPAQAATAK
ncbi:Inner membrane protein YjjP [Dermatophilus congolensis]|uniref:Inner membrane protein YjjP n=4 Tax=Dermatophilus congolensis TaxID=1863 RepID=A0AA46H067_9MICO|nr:threonine/serine exporter family protein [Dermatophilus congolensis]STD07468.1 Inner membrane protein YjjP [Dermatophilus congolensis]